MCPQNNSSFVLVLNGQGRRFCLLITTVFCTMATTKHWTWESCCGATVSGRCTRSGWAAFTPDHFQYIIWGRGHAINALDTSSFTQPCVNSTIGGSTDSATPVRVPCVHVHWRQLWSVEESWALGLQWASSLPSSETKHQNVFQSCLLSPSTHNIQRRTPLLPK